MRLVVREARAELVKVLANTGVGQRDRVLDVLAGELRGEDGAVIASRAGGEALRADLDRVVGADAVPDVFEFVLGVLVDLLPALGVVVVENFGCSQPLDKVEVLGRAGGYDGVARSERLAKSPACIYDILVQLTL